MLLLLDEGEKLNKERAPPKFCNNSLFPFSLAGKNCEGGGEEVGPDDALPPTTTHHLLP